MTDQAFVDASALGEEDIRIIRRLSLETGPTGEGDSSAKHVGIALDVETEGRMLGEHRIIELAVRRFMFDDAGVITKLDRSFVWREDPGRPLTEEIVKLTGRTDADLVGQAIDDDEVVGLITSAEFCCAHNAAFDRPRVELRLPQLAGRGWTCSMNDVDWRASGMDGRSLGWLLAQTGWFHEGHRADADVDALIMLLRHRLDDGRPALAHMLERAKRPSWRVAAVGAVFAVKDQLRARGYSWDPAARHWWKEVTDVDLGEEQWWLARNVYSTEMCPARNEPLIEEITWAERYR